MAELVKLHDDHPDPRNVRKVLDALNSNGLIVCPTDTVYSFAAKLGSPKGFDKLARAKGLKPEKAHFSVLCADLSDLSRYAQHISNPLFKTMKRLLPGPYTFVLPASGEVPKLYKGKKEDHRHPGAQPPGCAALASGTWLPPRGQQRARRR